LSAIELPLNDNPERPDRMAILSSIRAGILLRGDKRFDKIVAAAKAASR
jgi:hypothetical protein